MGKLAIIRASRNSNSHVLESLRNMGYRVVDICDRRQIRVSQVSNSAPTYLFLNGHNLDDFEQILFFGWPQTNLKKQISVDDYYFYAEITSAAAAAILLSSVRVVTSSELIGYSEYLSGSLRQLKILKSLGWKTSIIMYEYNKYNFPKIVNSPDTRNVPKYLLVFTKHRYRICSNAPLLGVSELKLEKIFNEMQNFIFETGREWVSVPAVVWEHDFYASGLSNTIPRSLNSNALNGFLTEIIN